MAKERIGILGGSFDPIHQGHIQTAVSALEACRLDRLYLLPAGDHAYKPSSALAEDRWKMVVAACSQDSRLLPSRFELDAPAPAYTVDTLLTLKKQHPKSELFFILGADGLLKLHHWHRLPEVLSLCTFVICPRPNVPRAAFEEEKDRLIAQGARISIIRARAIDISSTMIRDHLSRGLSTPNLYSPVREYCALKGLYGMNRQVERSEEWIDRLFAALTPHRFAHSLSVAGFSRRLATIHGVDPGKAEQAGLLHDCAKCMPLKEMQVLARSHRLTDDPTVLSSNALLHSLAGAWVAEHEYGMKDPEVLEAISWHNTGHAGMSRLAMVVCLADTIEPTRESFPLLEQVRAMSRISLERALLMSLEGTASYVISRGKFLHPRTQETIAWLKTLPEVREKS
ncbi:MAG: bis(5'-nucleosyl)-tetraphosphatase (symmetrical) YqeK [Clostridia bacterium]|nr:bis(5'-nucleosyl)-tetraphosphatase (symmetrical) YqeK [Clostridia bacterium]